MPYNSDLSLLLVENDPACLDVCRSILSMRFPKMIIHTALNPEEAMYKYKEQRHEIVVTDLFAPQKYGLIIAKKVCDINPHTAVIFITADTDTQWNILKHKAKRLCLEGIVHKPIDLKELIDKIAEAVGIISKNTDK